MFISLTTVNRINVDVRLYENVGVKYSNDNDNASKMISEVNNGFYCNCNDNNGYYHSTTPTPALFTPIASKFNGIDQKIYKNIILEYIFGIALYENNNGNEVCDSTLNHFSLCLFELQEATKEQEGEQTGLYSFGARYFILVQTMFCVSWFRVIAFDVFVVAF